LHIDRDSLEIIQKTGYKIFTGLSQGVVKVLKDQETQKVVGVALHPRDRPLGGRVIILPLPRGGGAGRMRGRSPIESNVLHQSKEP
jgi:hypothetical protein